MLRILIFSLLAFLVSTPAMADCTGPAGKEGATIYNQAYHVPQFCTGMNWVPDGPTAGSTGGGCTGPAGVEGQTLYNSAYHIMEYCNSTNWTGAGTAGAGGACTNPAGVEGQMLYNYDYRVMEFCSGTWRAIGNACSYNWVDMVSSGNKQWRSTVSSADGMNVIGDPWNEYPYITHDGGTTWAAITPLGSGYWGKGAMSSDGTKIIMTNGNYIYRSTDGGTTWATLSGAGSHNFGELASSADGTKLLAVTGSAYLYVSSDSGTTWTQHPELATSEMFGASMSADGQKMIVTTGYHGYVYISTDGGATWVDRKAASETPQAGGVSGDGKVFMYAPLGGNVYISTNDGVSWASQMLGTTHTGVAINYDGSKMAISDNSANAIYSSMNRGATWKTQTFSNQPLGVSFSSGGRHLAAAINNGDIWTMNCPSVSPGVAPAVIYANGYSHYRTVTIDYTKVPNTDQANFPVLVSGTYASLATTGNGGSVTSANGYDIIFTSDSGGSTQLSHEIESYNATTGAVSFWVKVPTVSHTAGTVIYMWYGKSSVTTSQENKNAVWDSNYKIVWHLPNGATLSAADSTSNAANGTISAATATTGKIGGGASFDGSTKYIQINSMPSYGGNLTFETWFKTGATGVILGNDDGTVPNTQPGGFVPALYVDTYGYLRASLFWHGGSNIQIVSGSTYADNAWHHVVDTYDGSVETLYVDGNSVGSQSVSQSSYSGTYGYFYGTGYTTNWANNPGGWSYLNGTMDDMRVSNAARSADWIKTEYNNQNSPSTFYAVGTEQ